MLAADGAVYGFPQKFADEFQNVGNQVQQSTRHKWE